MRRWSAAQADNAVRAVVAVAVGMLVQATNVEASDADWPSYNKTLTSERFSPLHAINVNNAKGLRVICTFDTGLQNAFQTGLVEVDGSLFATTEHDTISLDPNTCKVNWRTHEEFKSSFLGANRGLAWLDGRIYRGTSEGLVRAYDAKSGKALWSTSIADPEKGESVPAAPIAWNGMIFIGMAGGDNKGVKGRMYALNAADGRILWECYMVPKGPNDTSRGPEPAPAPGMAEGSWKNKPRMPITGGATWTSYSLDPDSGTLYVPAGNPAPDFVNATRQGDNLYANSIVEFDAKTGAFKAAVQLVKHDFHDWDVSGPPVLFTSKSGSKLMAATPKDGNLFVIDRKSGKVRFKTAVTKMLNRTMPIADAGTRFCPGSQGGAEWNGPAYDPLHNTLMTGEVEWCTSVKVLSETQLQNIPAGQAWSGATFAFGNQDDPHLWAGWMTATDADTGRRRWRFRAPNPLLGGTTPTGGGLVFFGDMGGNFFALSSNSGAKIWSADLGGAVAGGVITYDTGAGQKIAVAVGMTSPIWTTPKINGKIVVLGL